MFAWRYGPACARGETAIVGESLAGLFALETFFYEPDLFDTYIAISPSLWWNDLALAKTAAARLSAPDKYVYKTLFLAREHEEDSGTGAQIVADALRAAAVPGLTWHYAPMPEERHGTIYHGAALKAFRTVFAPVPVISTRPGGR